MSVVTKSFILDFVESRVDDTRLDGIDGGCSTRATIIIGADGLGVVGTLFRTLDGLRLSLGRGETVIAHFDDDCGWFRSII